MGRTKSYELVGQRFNYLLVIGRSEKDYRKYKCLCDCGKEHETTKQRLINGRCKSCGCMKTKLSSEANRKHGGYSEGKNCPEYQSYVAMMHRCYNQNRKNYNKYGGAGIVVTEDSWLQPSPHGYLSFLEDMGKRPDGTTLDRINGELGYSKENCRWADRRLQAVNTKCIKTEKNTSKYRGVSKRKKTGRFMARIGNGKGSYEWLGEYDTEEDAAEAYNKRAIELHGENAKLNVI